MYKSVWLENLVLINKLIQKSGGIMEIVSSYTDFEGNVLCRIYLSKALSPENESIYEEKRLKKG